MTDGRSPQLAPAQAAERSELLDALRGIALAGIVGANMVLYSLYDYLPDSAKRAMGTYAADRVLDFLELFLIEGKFYTIFSLLFGVGFSVLLSRARAKDVVFHRFYLRRIGVLFLIGVAHAVLLWDNDILQAYAVCGALLLPLRTARDRTILILAVLFLLAPIPVKLAGGIPVGGLADAEKALYDRFGFAPDAEIATWTQGSYWDVLRMNLSRVPSQVSFLLRSGMIFKIYGCFLLGFCAGRREIYRKVEWSGPALALLAAGGFAIGLPLNAAYAASFRSDSWLETLSAAFGILPLSLAYVAVFCLLWRSGEWRKRLRVFAPVGRMALTNYVGQSAAGMLLFYGTGARLGGKVGPTLYLPIAFAVYSAEVAASRWWLARFRFGPLEWLWRSLTYGKWLPIAGRAAA
jgi:uncharacterized protein